MRTHRRSWIAAQAVQTLGTRAAIGVLLTFRPQSA